MHLFQQRKHVLHLQQELLRSPAWEILVHRFAVKTRHSQDHGKALCLSLRWRSRAVDTRVRAPHGAVLLAIRISPF
jgi:hypothetical protein